MAGHPDELSDSGTLPGQNNDGRSSDTMASFATDSFLTAAASLSIGLIHSNGFVSWYAGVHCFFCERLIL